MEESGGSVREDALERFAAGLEEALSRYGRERSAFLNHLFSYSPLTEADRREVEGLVMQLGDERIDAREQATAALLARGRPALMVLRTLPAATDAEVRARTAFALRELERLDALVEAGGWERDVPYLAEHTDPRARRRLDRILSRLAPFDGEGLSGISVEALSEWWLQAQERIRWDTDRDCFVECDPGNEMCRAGFRPEDSFFMEKSNQLSGDRYEHET